MTDNAHTAPTGAPHTTTDAPRRFRRDRSDAMLAGVCAGAANLLGIDATIIRVLLVVATLFGFGTGILVYLACWLIVPEQQ